MHNKNSIEPFSVLIKVKKLSAFSLLFFELALLAKKSPKLHTKFDTRHIARCGIYAENMRKTCKRGATAPRFFYDWGLQTASRNAFARRARGEGGVLKKVRAHVIDYAVTLRNTETGSELRLSLSQLADCAQTPAEIDAFLRRKRLRFHETYLQALLQAAFECFVEKRRQFAESAGVREGGRAGKESARAAQNHQMLIIAMSNAHAAAILDFVREKFPEFISERIRQDIAARDR